MNQQRPAGTANGFLHMLRGSSLPTRNNKSNIRHLERADTYARASTPADVSIGALSSPPFVYPSTTPLFFASPCILGLTVRTRWRRG